MEIKIDERKVKKTIFPQKFRERIKDNNHSPRGKFHGFLFPFSSKFSVLIFASYVLSIYPYYVTWHTQWASVTCGVMSEDREVKSSFVYIHLAFVRTISPASKVKRTILRQHLQQITEIREVMGSNPVGTQTFIFVPPSCHVDQFDLVSCWYVDFFSHLIGSFLWNMGWRHGHEQFLMKDMFWPAQKDSVAVANFHQLNNVFLQTLQFPPPYGSSCCSLFW